MSIIDDDTRTARIALLNDALRKACFGGTLLFTAGVQRLGPVFLTHVLEALRHYDDFREDNDPHGEHDFGKLIVSGEEMFWKIDYYDQNLEFGSEDPADANLTRRVLTVMLVEEY